ncbi:MAG: hypothetical protein II137_07920 [Anaerovibrio sp.]|jgi:hypothetical protein|uniref:hypothetical protein n=1 Tax=Anaerovibrio lipolyticus TaxID=82374 RepID=UPI000485631E|nr:hypothetical protein [Anaerovibrio lipolyticus]MBQ1856499.1 hypothetical protein [Anaerovibrio sp.]
MICQKCGSQLNMDGTCPNCGQGNVRIMEKSEINAYDGITIEENSYEQENARTEKNDSSFGGFGGFGGSDRGPRIIRFSSGSSTLTKLLFAVAIALLVAGVVFVALPLMVLAVIVGLAVYMIYSFLT